MGAGKGLRSKKTHDLRQRWEDQQGHGDEAGLELLLRGCGGSGAVLDPG